MHNSLSMSAIDLGHQIRAHSLSSRDVVEAHIARIEQVNPTINAVIAPRFEAARQEAAEADARIEKGEKDLPPLFGVPCTIKEFIAVSGQPHTGGLHARRQCIANEDAELVRRLKDAGVIILGSTNAPEGGLWIETYNTLYGRTDNPWNVKLPQIKLQ